MVQDLHEIASDLRGELTRVVEDAMPDVRVRWVTYRGSPDAGHIEIKLAKIGIKLIEADQCGNCDKVWFQRQINPIDDVWERHEPGDTFGSGQCPACGSLTHRVEISLATAIALKLCGSSDNSGA